MSAPTHHADVSAQALQSGLSAPTHQHITVQRLRQNKTQVRLLHLTAGVHGTSLVCRPRHGDDFFEG